MNKELFKEFSDQGEISLVFYKKDNTKRNMICTTSSSLLNENQEEFGYTPPKGEKTTPDNPKIATVWDIEKKGWRAVTLENVVQIRLNGDLKYKKFVQIIDKLDDKMFVEFPKKISTLIPDHAVLLYNNMWSMFNLKHSQFERKKFSNEKLEPFGMNVVNYGWTFEVKTAFYEHPYHAPIVKKFRQNKMDWGMWTLDSEPSEMDMFSGLDVLIEDESRGTNCFLYK